MGVEDIIINTMIKTEDLLTDNDYMDLQVDLMI